MNLYIVGPDPNAFTGGGLSSYQSQIIGEFNRAHPDLNVVHVSTYLDANPFYRLVCYVKSVLFFIFLKSPRDSVLHINFSIRGSLLRKIPLIFIAKLKGLKVIAHSHGADIDERYRLAGPFARKMFVKALNMADFLICISKYWVDFYSEIGVDGHKLRMLLNPIDTNFPTDEEIFKNQSENNREISIVFVGGLSERKGVGCLLRAIQQVASSNTEIKFRLHLVGGADPVVFNGYKDLALSLGIEDLVVFHGWVSRDKISRNYENAQIFVLASVSEGLPIAMLEAMSFGLAVIVTPVGGIADLIVDGESGRFVPVNDSNRLGNAIIELMSNPALRSKLGVRAKKSVEDLHVTPHCRELLSIYIS